MKTKQLRPVQAPRAYIERIAGRITKVLRRQIYDRLLGEAPGERLQNSREDLTDALQRGTVIYEDGRFTGRFTAAISKELRAVGAAWDKASSSFRIAPELLGRDVVAAITIGQTAQKARLSQLGETLAKLDPAEIAGKVRATDLFDAALWKTNEDLSKTLRSISIQPALTAEQRRRLASEWQENLEKWITDFTAGEIKALRQDVQKALFAGQRYEHVAKAIKRSYGVTERKAKFLARQETNLLVAKFKEVRYADAGVHEYRWRCVAGSPLHPVRPSHKALDGKVFRFDAPPITTAPGQAERRNNPGEDFNCRCTAVPVVRFKEAR